MQQIDDCNPLGKNGDHQTCFGIKLKIKGVC